MSELQLLFQHLKQPEYLHVLLNPLPLYGTAAGVFVLAVSMFRSRSKEQSAALLWLAFVGVATWLAFEYGEKGYDRVFAMSNTDARQWLEVHMYRAEKLAWVFYATALAALTALFGGKRWPRATTMLAGITLALGLASVFVAGWISHPGGQVRHSEFREGPPPPNLLPLQDERHSHGEAQSSVPNPEGHSHEHDH